MKAREHAADVVFGADQRGTGRDSKALCDPLRQCRIITAAETPLPEYSIQIIEGVANSLRYVDDLIVARTKVSGLDRTATVGPAVIRVAVQEMLEDSENVSAIITIDEAVSIVKSLSTGAVPSLISAILDVIRKDLETPAWTHREASIVEDESVLDSKDGPALDLEDEGEEPTEEHDDAEDAPLSPEFVELGEEGFTDELSDEELAELDELLDGY